MQSSSLEIAETKPILSKKLVQKVDEVYQYRNDYIKNMSEADWKRTSNKELFEIIADENI